MKDSLLKLKGFGKKMSVKYSDSCLACLEEKAERFHNEIININNHLARGAYILETKIHGWKSTNHYKLKVKIKYNESSSGKKHKENKHYQKIYI